MEIVAGVLVVENIAEILFNILYSARGTIPDFFAESNWKWHKGYKFSRSFDFHPPYLRNPSLLSGL